MVTIEDLKSSLIDIPDNIASKRWLFWISICFSGISIVGSIVTIIFAILAVFALLLHSFDKQRFLPNITEKKIAFILLCYIGISAVFSLLHSNILEGMKFTFNNMAFIIFIIIFPVVRVYAKPYWIERLFLAVSLGLILSGLIVIFQTVALYAVRPHALTANPLLLSTMAAGFSLFSLHKFFEVNSKIRYLHFFAFFLTCVIIFITGSRGAMLGLGLSCLSLFVFHTRNFLKTPSKAFQNIYIFFLLSIVMYELLLNSPGFDYVIQRFDAERVVTQYFTGGGSINARVEMATGGWIAFLESPWVGYGRQNIIQVTSDVLGSELIKYSHLHNAFITEMVSSGILGLLSITAVCFLPIYVAWNAHSNIRALAFAWTVGWVIIIMSGIGFYHDIMICYFCLILMFFHLIVSTEAIKKT